MWKQKKTEKKKKYWKTERNGKLHKGRMKNGILKDKEMICFVFSFGCWFLKKKAIAYKYCVRWTFKGRLFCVNCCFRLFALDKWDYGGFDTQISLRYACEIEKKLWYFLVFVWFLDVKELFGLWLFDLNVGFWFSVFELNYGKDENNGFKIKCGEFIWSHLILWTRTF